MPGSVSTPSTLYLACSMTPQPRCAAPRASLRRLCLPILVRFLLPTPAIVRIAYLLAVELGLMEPLVHDVVDVAAPAGRCFPRRHLGRVLGQHLRKVFGALSAAIAVSLRTYKCLSAAPAAGGAWRTMDRAAGTGGRMTSEPPSRRPSAPLGSERKSYVVVSTPRDPVRPCDVVASQPS